MNQVKDAQIIRLVERISEHYRANISNRFIRPALLQLSIDKVTWDQIETLTEKFEQFRYQGFLLDELYLQIAASARFVYAARNEIVPTLRHRLSSSVGADKILRDMAVSTFSSNLQLFADLLYDLYLKLTAIDTATAKNRRPLYEQIPELSDIGSQLGGR